MGGSDEGIQQGYAKKIGEMVPRNFGSCWIQRQNVSVLRISLQNRKFSTQWWQCPRLSVDFYFLEESTHCGDGVNPKGPKNSPMLRKDNHHMRQIRRTPTLRKRKCLNLKLNNVIKLVEEQPTLSMAPNGPLATLGESLYDLPSLGSELP